jgi:anhydro-N-acetylmuramic acid kinase
MQNWSRYRPPQSHELAVELAEAQAEIDGAHASAVAQLLTRTHVSPDAIGYHGQTIFHAPDEGWTWQLGDGAALARAVNRSVVWDFRTADMEVGGEGAPLAPFFHFALAKQMGATEPVAFLNIGGVANVTWVDPSKDAPEEEGALLAFDTGPGNALINDWMVRHGREPLDRDGAEAAKGQVDEMALHSNATGAFLKRKPPKSLDRNEFALALDRMTDLSLPDGAATLTALTVECVAEALNHMPVPPARWLVCGGGRKNPIMMAMLAERLGAPVDSVDAVGFDGDMLEAQAFAYLAVRSLRGLPLSALGTTACREPVTGGQLSHP